MTEAEVEELREAIAERDAAESRLARVATLCDVADRWALPGIGRVPTDEIRAALSPDNA